MKTGTPEVNLYVRDLARSVRFYHLGLQFAFEGYVTADGAVVEDINTEGEFACATVLAPGLRINLIPAGAGGSPGGAADHLIQVANVDAVHATVLETGGRPSGVVNQPWQRREFTVADDDGYEWTVAAPVRGLSDQSQARETGEITGYVSAREYREAARAQGLSLQQYLDRNWGTKTATLSDFSEGVFREVAKFGVFDRPTQHVVEIGTGVGMHVPTVLRLGRPESYESYEPERDWAEWLAEEYGVISHDCDGVSLRQTPTASVDLVHAHGVFVALPFLTTVQYFREMGRVLRPGGFAVFDILSEECMDEVAIETWLASEWRWPIVLNREFVKGLMQRRGLAFVGDFRIATTDEAGKCPANYLIFRRV
jgi:SAM-dependent methyltransferase